MAGSLETILAALEGAGVRYLVVGGVAVVLHGHPRFTADLDLVLDLEPRNVEAALGALAALGFRPRAPVAAASFADPATRSRWASEKHMTVFSLWSPTMPATEVDLFVTPPLPFDEAYARALRAPLPATTVSVVCRDDLIAMKRRAGRPVDLEDVRALEALAREAGDG